MIHTALIKDGAIVFLSTDENGNCEEIGEFHVKLTQNNAQVIEDWIEGTIEADEIESELD